MKMTDIDTVEKFVTQAVSHLPSLASIYKIEVSNYFNQTHCTM